MPTVVNYLLTRGLPWNRLVAVKSRRTRWRLNVADTNAYLALPSGIKIEIPSEVTSEGIISLSLTTAATIDLPVGDLPYDIWATVQVALDETKYIPVARGTITVSSYSNITPSDGVDTMQLKFTQRTDFRRTFSLQDAAGNVQQITDAYMQADDSNGTPVLDIRWYASKPNEAAVIALSPANRRGYIAPYAGKTFELHISNTNTVAAGTYSFDIFVQNTDGDWYVPVKGTIVVESAVSSPP